MSRGFPYSVTNDSVMVIIDGHPTTVMRSAPNFALLRAAVIAEQWDDVRAHLRAGSSLSKWARGRFTVKDSTVLFDDVPVPSDFNNRIVEMATAGESPEPLFRFWERLQRNPSARSVEQLWRFLNLVGIPLTEDGHFLGYKGVRMDYKDCHSGTIDNHPGQAPSVPRNKVSDDPQTACHFGLHVGSLEYATSFGRRVVIVKVDPEHVVCVPYDCTSQKMRVCEYEVVGLHGDGHMQSTTIPDDDWIDDLDEDDFDDLDDLDDEFDEALDAVAADDAAGTTTSARTFFLNEKQELPPTQKTLHKKVPKWIRDLHVKDEVELHQVNMDLLRKYASKALRIVGAYRMSGGKAALITAIGKARS
jgi:hypothetical protein